MGARPTIGITPDFAETQGPAGSGKYELKTAYCDAVLRAGGLPVVLPYARERAAIEAYLKRVQGLLISGGGFDIPPSMYGQRRKSCCGPLKKERSDFELALARGALAHGMPLLGVCGGMQLLNVLRGGTLYQDIEEELPGADNHQQAHDRRRPFHEVRVATGTTLGKALGRGALQVNSTHHQAVRELGRRLRIGAVARDGLVEGIEAEDLSFAVGVQWHPEMLLDSVPRNLGLYRSFVRAAARHRS